MYEGVYIYNKTNLLYVAYYNKLIVMFDYFSYHRRLTFIHSSTLSHHYHSHSISALVGCESLYMA